MNGLVSRFTSFDRLIATSLIKFLYWVGMIVIALVVLFGAFSGFGRGFMSGLGTLIAAPIAGALMVIFWRFLCELYLVIFGMYNRLGEINEKLGAKSDN